MKPSYGRLPAVAPSGRISTVIRTHSKKELLAYLFSQQHFRFALSRNMSQPNTSSFLRPVHPRNMLNSDYNDNGFGSQQVQTFRNEHSNNNNISFNLKNFAISRIIIHDPVSFQVDQNIPTDFKFNSSGKHIFVSECQRFGLDRDDASFPVPNNDRTMNDKLGNPISVADDQVSNLKTFTKKKYLLANHSYIDFSRVEDEKITNSSSFHGERLEAIMNFGAAMHPSHFVAINDVNPADNAKSTPQNRITCPTKLMSLLENNPDPNVITWLPHGRAFILKDNTRFMNELSSSLCKSNNFKSFQRMLNIWGFKRLTGKRDKGAYYHQLFLKGRPNLVKKMSICKKKNGVWPLANPASEPDFYQLSKLRPLQIT